MFEERDSIEKRIVTQFLLTFTSNVSHLVDEVAPSSSLVDDEACMFRSEICPWSTLSFIVNYVVERIPDSTTSCSFQNASPFREQVESKGDGKWDKLNRCWRADIWRISRAMWKLLRKGKLLKEHGAPDSFFLVRREFSIPLLDCAGLNLRQTEPSCRCEGLRERRRFKTTARGIFRRYLLYV